MVRQFTEKNHHVVGLARDEKGQTNDSKVGWRSIIGDIYDAESLAKGVAAFTRPTLRTREVLLKAY